MIRLFPAKRGGRLRLSVLLVVLALVAYFHQAECVFYLTRPSLLYAYFRYQPQEGDVVFQTLPHGDLVDAIEGITHSPYSHCGVVLRNSKGQWVVIESIFTVHQTPLLLWMLRGRSDGEFAAYRLDPKYASNIPAFKSNLLAYSGRPYDYQYDMSSDQSVYCSDLVYLAFNKARANKWAPCKSWAISTGSRLRLLSAISREGNYRSIAS